MQRAAVSERGVGVRQLERGDEQLALPDRKVDRGASEPGSTEHRVVVLAIGDDPRPFVRDLEPRVDTQAHESSPLLDALVEPEAILAEPFSGPKSFTGDLVVVRVARDGDRPRHVDTAAAVERTSEQARIGLDRAVRIEVLAGVDVLVTNTTQGAWFIADHAFLHGGDCGDELEGRPGRIGALDRTVEDRRVVGLGGQRVELGE